MNLPNEDTYAYEYRVTMNMLNGDGLIKPDCYQTMICDVAESHLSRLHLNVEDLAPYHVAWVLISAAFEIVTPIRSEQRVIGHTWHSAQDKLTFRRDLSFTDLQGNPLFHAATFTVLMDTQSRRIVRPDQADFAIGEPLPRFTMEAFPKLRCRSEMQPCDHRKVYPSYIDCLGHTNNGRYSEFAYDALTHDELSQLASLRRMDVNYLSELRLGDTFTVRRGYDSRTPSDLLIDGVNDATGKPSFFCRLRFAQ